MRTLIISKLVSKCAFECIEMNFPIAICIQISANEHKKFRNEFVMRVTGKK